MYNNDTNIGLDIFLFIVVAMLTFGISRCANALADADLKKVSPTAKAGQFRNSFRSFSNFLSLPNVRNVHRTESFGTPAVIVHFTWQECSGSGDNYHCYTEHDEVTIPEVNLPEQGFDGKVDIDYEGFDMVVN